MRVIECKTCNSKTIATSNSQKYCKECTSKPIFNDYIKCSICEKIIYNNSHRQKYCLNCAKIIMRNQQKKSKQSEKSKIKERIYRNLNREEINKRLRIWTKENRYKCNESQKKYRNTEKGIRTTFKDNNKHEAINESIIDFKVEHIRLKRLIKEMSNN